MRGPRPAHRPRPMAGMRFIELELQFVLPERAIEQAIGRKLNAETDLLVTRDELLKILDSAGKKLLTFRILSE